MAATTLDYNGPAPVENDGVLDCWVQQPNNNALTIDANGNSNYFEKWKGPYKRTKTLFSAITSGDTIDKFHNWLGANRIAPFEIPVATYKINDTLGNTTIENGVWIIKSITIDDLTAGDHCIINVDFEVGQVFSESSTLLEDDSSNVWSISWQSYSVTPYEFASGEVHPPLPISPSNKGYQINWGAKASRTMIETYKANSPQVIDAENAGGDNVVAYCYTPDPTTPDYRETLCGAEIELLKKVNANRCATYHYPIVTHQTAFKGSVGMNFTQNLGGDLDTITELPDECPYTFADIKGNEDGKWFWIKIGDDIVQSKTLDGVRYERREMWAGYTDVDENYYGDTPFTHSEDGIKTSRWYKNCL